MKRLCSNKGEAMIALPLVREALAHASGVTLDCTADTMTLTIEIDMKIILALIVAAIRKQGEAVNSNSRPQ